MSLSKLLDRKNDSTKKNDKGSTLGRELTAKESAKAAGGAFENTM